MIHRLKDKNFITNFALFLTFFGLALFGLLHHELWLDEARPWLIAKSNDFYTLSKVLQYEAHPITWYALLKLSMNVYDNAIDIQILSLLLGCFSFALICFYSPFTRLQKALLSLNYYLLFEYTIIGRNYSLEILFLTLVCCIYQKRHLFPIQYSLVLVMLLFSHPFGSVFSLVFLFYFIYECTKKSRFRLRNTSCSILIISIAIGYFFFQTLRPDNAISVIDLNFLSTERILQSLSFFFESLFLIVSPFVHSTNVTIYQNFPVFNTYSWVLGLLILGMCLNTLKKNKDLISIFALIFMGLFFLRTANRWSYYGFNHLGQNFLLLFVFFWLVTQNSKPNKSFHLFFNLILGFQAISGASYLYADYLKPFSEGSSAAQFLKNSNLNGVEIFPEHPFLSSSYLTEGDHKFYDFDRNQLTTYLPSDNTILGDKDYSKVQLVSRDFLGVPKTQANLLIKRIKDREIATNRKLIVISNYPLLTQVTEPCELLLVKSFTESLNPFENFYIYALRQ